jgi:hypothetical protein
MRFIDMDDELSKDVLAQIEAALFGGRKIEAIRLYREATGKGLLDAKNAIDAIEADLRAAGPERFNSAQLQESSPSTGCLGVFLLALGVSGAAAVMLGR